MVKETKLPKDLNISVPNSVAFPQHHSTTPLLVCILNKQKQIESNFMFMQQYSR